MSVKKNVGQKILHITIWVQKDFGSNTICDYKSFGSKKIACPKKMLVQKKSLRAIQDSVEVLQKSECSHIFP